MIKSFLIFLILFNISTYAKETLIWPPAPAKARIAFDKIVQKAKDVTIEKSFFSKVIDFVLGEEEVSLTKPFGIHVDENDVIYVTDTADNSIFIFNERKNKFSRISGTKKQNFASPIDVKTDLDGNIYVSDSILGYIFVFDKDEKFIKKIGTDEKLSRPTGIAINNLRDEIYITDTVEYKIKVYSLKGVFKRSFGQAGEANGSFNKPTFITFDKEQNLYVSDSMNHRIQIFDKNDKFLRTFGHRGKVAGTFASPRGITVDIDGNIYVSDTLFNTIQVFNNKGQLLMFFGKTGMKKGEFAFPAGISISDKNKIYVADSYNMRIQAFNLIKYKDEE